MSTELPLQAPSLRVCYFGTYRAEYSRNRIMIEGLRRNGVEVIECQEQLWHSIEDRVQAVSGGWKRPRFWWRAVAAYVRLLRRFWQVRRAFDVLVVGYPGQFDVFLAKLLCLWLGVPLIWDVFMSIYLIAWERNLHQHSPIVVNAIRLLERWATRLPNLLIMDTAEYVNWFQQTHAVNSDRCRLIPTGADSNIFRPVSHHTTVNKRLRVVYYGSYIPNHGVLNIVEAAALLQERPEIQFEMIGDGPMRHQAESLAQSYQLTNITFLDWLTQESLVEHVGSADLCLGVFGTTPQSLMTVQNKIYECLAMARPVLSGVGPAVQAALSDGIEIYLCERANPQALASAIEDLYAAPEVRKRIGEMGYRRFLLEYDLSQIGAVFLKHIRETIER